MLEQDIRQAIAALLAPHAAAQGAPATAGGADPEERLEFQPIIADGSSRRFIRVFRDLEPCGLAVLAASASDRDRGEFRSALAIARHLRRQGVGVPAVLAADTSLGLILFEDLGDHRLYDLLRGETEARRLQLYRRVIEALVHMQVAGAAGFDPSWCYDSETYDRTVMVERESGYFCQAFWKDTLFGEEVDGLAEEFERLAARVLDCFEPLFLHRDFQSRNVMVKDDEVRIIDFQGGRLGPPGYDIAALLIDPYIGLSSLQQEGLFDFYRQRLAAVNGPASAARMESSYPYLALQRNLQIIGAFAFLSGQKRKPFFARFLLPSLIMLSNRLSEPRFEDFPLLRRTAAESIRRYRLHFNNVASSGPAAGTQRPREHGAGP